MAILSPVPIASSDRVLFCGDSITAFTLGRVWYLNLITRVNATWQRAPSYYSGRHRNSAGTIPAGRELVVMNSAIGGQVIADLVTNFTAQIAFYNPTLCFVEIGSNDADGSANGGTPTTIGAYTTSLASLASLFAAQLPSCRVVKIPPLCVGEVWTSGTPNTWGPNAGSHDGLIDQINAADQAQCSASGWGFADVRAAGLVSEAAGNPSHSASGYLTVSGDGKHLTQTGKQLFCDTAYAQLSIAA